MQKLSPKSEFQRGFTLLEIIIVMAVIGLILATVRYTTLTDDPQKEIEQHVKRLQVVFNMASDYAVINQLELGLRIDEKKRNYEFVAFGQDERWMPITEGKQFEKVELPDGVYLELLLDGLEWQDEDSLFDSRVFDEQLSVSNDSVEIGSDEDKIPPPPQIFILSSGEITPFELTVKYQAQTRNEEDFEFMLQGQDTVPLKLVAPEI
jgi:general secretion pathway protein H